VTEKEVSIKIDKTDGTGFLSPLSWSYAVRAPSTGNKTVYGMSRTRRSAEQRCAWVVRNGNDGL